MDRAGTKREIIQSPTELDGSGGAPPKRARNNQSQNQQNDPNQQQQNNQQQFQTIQLPIRYQDMPVSTTVTIQLI